MGRNQSLSLRLVQVWGVYRHSETAENCQIGHKYGGGLVDVTSVVPMNNLIIALGEKGQMSDSTGALQGASQISAGANAPVAPPLEPPLGIGMVASGERELTLTGRSA